jgi:hypothetical protein
MEHVCPRQIFVLWLLWARRIQNKPEHNKGYAKWSRYISRHEARYLILTGLQALPFLKNKICIGKILINLSDMKFQENTASITDALFNFVINSPPIFRGRFDSLCCRFYSKIKNTAMTKCDLENGALLSCYAGGSGNSLTTLRHNLSVPSSRVKNPPPPKKNKTP